MCGCSGSWGSGTLLGLVCPSAKHRRPIQACLPSKSEQPPGDLTCVAACVCNCCDCLWDHQAHPERLSPDGLPAWQLPIWHFCSELLSFSLSFSRPAKHPGRYNQVKWSRLQLEAARQG